MQYPSHEWAHFDLLQDFIQNTGELGEPALNQQPPPLQIIDNAPPESLPEIPMAPEHPSKTGPGINGHRYTCQACPFASNIKRDYDRHLRTLKHRKNTRIGGTQGALEPSGPNAMSFRCPVPDCKFNASGKTFSRDDHLWRHIRKVHDIMKQM